MIGVVCMLLEGRAWSECDLGVTALVEPAAMKTKMNFSLNAANI